MNLLSQYRTAIRDEWVRYNCPFCDDNKGRFCVKFDGHGWFYHCFNCHPKMKYHSLLLDSTPAETLKYLEHKPTPIDHEDVVELPKDSSVDLRLCSGLSWLKQYGILMTEIIQYGICYSPSLDRLILPSYIDGELLCWQGRYVGDEKRPKYITQSPKGQFNLFKSQKHERRDVVLVEDIISAIKVGRVTNAIAILGSYVSPKILTHIKEYDKIFIWLDYDKLFEAYKYQQRINALLGKPVHVVVTNKDPKEYGTEEIRRFLHGTSN